ncbi:hypothetical protein BH11PAT1_BH11PAT1_3450 [soil metagenome]
MPRISPRAVLTHLLAVLLGGGLALYGAGWIFPAKPGGVWLTPQNGVTTPGPILIQLRAYRTYPWDQGVKYVNVTGHWTGLPAGPWPILCRLEKPVEGDVYSCLVDPRAGGIEPGTALTLSFDVYDWRRGKNLSPHGSRTIKFVP